MLVKILVVVPETGEIRAQDGQHTVGPEQQAEQGDQETTVAFPPGGDRCHLSLRVIDQIDEVSGWAKNTPQRIETLLGMQAEPWLRDPGVVGPDGFFACAAAKM